jgi:Uma2 family endonuclease
MTWLEVCNDPSLRNLPYKVELDRWGRVVMSPHRREHGACQGRIAVLLDGCMPRGHVISECAIETPDGVKVADVAWASRSRWAGMADRPCCSIAPQICIEVTSSSNTEAEILEKRALYFAAGAIEVWVCDEDGRVTFHGTAGALKRSALCPKFPRRVRP